VLEPTLSALFRAMRSGGQGQPSARLRVRTLAFVRLNAADLFVAAFDRCFPCLEFHIADHGLIAFCPWMDFPVPPRRRILLNVKINAMMFHYPPVQTYRTKTGKPCDTWRNAHYGGRGSPVLAVAAIVPPQRNERAI
jgi:hypothetical protein